jgi:hypothetical protein
MKLVRMGRLELPRPLQALEPKCIFSARSDTNSLHHHIVPQQQPQRSSSEEQLNPADNLRTSPPSHTYKEQHPRKRSEDRVDPFSDVSRGSQFGSLLYEIPLSGGFYRQHSCAPGARSPLDCFWSVFTKRS